MSHLITFNCTKVRPQSDFFRGFHSSLMFCTFCACTKGQFLIKTQFYDLIRFISIDSMFVPNLERIGPSSQIKDTKYHFFLKMAKYPCLKGGFPVMAEITRILAANIRRRYFFVIATATSTRCLVQNFQLICYWQRVNATSQYNDSGSSTCSKWQNDRMVAVVKHCWLLVQGRRSCRER